MGNHILGSHIPMRLKFWFYVFREIVLLGIIGFLMWFVFSEKMYTGSNLTFLLIIIFTVAGFVYFLIGNTRFLRNLYRDHKQSRIKLE